MPRKPTEHLSAQELERLCDEITAAGDELRTMSERLTEGERVPIDNIVSIRNGIIAVQVAFHRGTAAILINKVKEEETATGVKGKKKERGTKRVQPISETTDPLIPIATTNGLYMGC